MQALESPEALLDSMKKDNISEYLRLLAKFAEKDVEKEFNEQINQIDQIIKGIEILKEQIRQQLFEFKNIQENFKNLRESFFEKILYNKFCLLIFQLQEFDNQLESDQYKEVAKELSETVDKMLNNDCALISKEIEHTIYSHQQILFNLKTKNDEQLQKQITLLFQERDQYIYKLQDNIQCFNQSQLLSNQFFEMIEQKIQVQSSKKIIYKKLIHKGSKDGLNSRAFWNNINGKKNLLMIFKSKNKGNYIFGGYSPCQWQANAGYVQDDTLTSFIFSQTFNQIYQLKQDHKQYAIFCKSENGPTFGGGHDIYINSNFNSGYSNLGHSYQWNLQKNTYNEMLFGGAQPNIVECEIYQINFL